jgi:hypothetical protein
MLIAVHWQLALINSQILQATTGPLKGKAPIKDPMEGIVHAGMAHAVREVWHDSS